ncbi:MAG: twitching motility protein PilT [Anaerolineaceae bacterium]|nr:twitching motility protein PilT [Anaerolineaceae bacterium]
MPAALFIFSTELWFFLSPGTRQGGFLYPFDPGQSIKHLVESVGVPHTEVGKVTRNETLSSLDTLAEDGNQIGIYPNVPGQAIPAEGPRFVLDNHLGRLAAYLRMFGFDCIYRNDLQDEELAQITNQEKRILLTRDRRLLMRRAVVYGYCLRSLDSQIQTVEVLKRYNLNGQISPFRRCLRCNTLIEPVRKEAILDRLQPLTQLYYDEFHLCPTCGHVYWKGSHYKHMLALMEKIL